MNNRSIEIAGGMFKRKKVVFLSFAVLLVLAAVLGSTWDRLFRKAMPLSVSESRRGVIQIEAGQAPLAAEDLGDRDLLGQGSSVDIEELAAWVAAMPIGEARKQAIRDLAIMWAGTNSAAAVDWIGRLPEGDERDGAFIAAAYEMVRTDPVQAMVVALDLPVSKEKDVVIQHIALQWAGNDPDTAAIWAKDLSDATLKGRIQSNIATVWGENDPRRAAQYAVLSMTPGKPQDDAVIAIVQRWAQKDPEAAADWVSAFPDGALSETAAENIIKLWPGGFPRVE